MIGAHRFRVRFCITRADASHPRHSAPSWLSSRTGGSRRGGGARRLKPHNIGEDSGVPRMQRSVLPAMRSIVRSRCTADPGAILFGYQWLPALRSSVNNAAPRPGHVNSRYGSQHAWQHAIRWLVVVKEGSDVDDHLLAHLDTAFDGGR